MDGKTSLVTHRLFQSTPSAWRETKSGSAMGNNISISIHSLRMEGDFVCTHMVCIVSAFQSTPSAWRETVKSMRYVVLFTFQSTPSAWRETSLDSTRISHNKNFNPLPPHGGRPFCPLDSQMVHSISIHSLRMEGDWVLVEVSLTRIPFQSTPSAWRETTLMRCHSPAVRKFQSTPSAWRET